MRGLSNVHPKVKIIAGLQGVPDSERNARFDPVSGAESFDGKRLGKRPVGEQEEADSEAEFGGRCRQFVKWKTQVLGEPQPNS